MGLGTGNQSAFSVLHNYAALKFVCVIGCIATLAMELFGKRT